MQLLIEPQGIEIVSNLEWMTVKELLIEPQGIEIHLVVILVIPPVVF